MLRKTLPSSTVSVALSTFQFRHRPPRLPLDDWEWRNAKELNNRLLLVIQRIRGMGLQVYDSVGNFVLIDFGSAERSTAADAYLRSRGHAGVAAYGLASCLRMTIGAEADMDFIFGALERFIGAKARAHDRAQPKGRCSIP